MAFKLKSGNAPKFKMMGVSPIKKVPPHVYTHTPVEVDTGEDVDEARRKKEQEEALRIKAANDAANEENKKGTEPPKYDEFGNTIVRSGEGDSFMHKPIMEVLGLTKKQREARKVKKAEILEEARTAVGSGTETLKQAKLVKRDDKRKARAEKRKARDKEKLAKFRKKNPKI